MNSLCLPVYLFHLSRTPHIPALGLLCESEWGSHIHMLKKKVRPTPPSLAALRGQAQSASHQPILRLRHGEGGVQLSLCANLLQYLCEAALPACSALAAAGYST